MCRDPNANRVAGFRDHLQSNAGLPGKEFGAGNREAAGLLPLQRHLQHGVPGLTAVG